MRGLRAVWRGLRDVLDHPLASAKASLVWWIGVVLIISAPAATLTLFYLTDPRLGISSDRPTWREAAHFMRHRIGRGWRLALITVPVLILVAFNLGFYASRESRIGILTPLWIFFAVLAISATLCAFSVSGTQDLSAVPSAKAGIRIAAPGLLYVLLALGVVTVLGFFLLGLVIPFLLFVPAMVASVINRLTLEAMRVEIIDPGLPTPERVQETRRRGR